MLQVKSPYHPEIDLGKSQVLFNCRPQYLENLHDYEPPLLWTPDKKLGGKISDVSGVLLYEDDFDAVERDFAVELDNADLRRLKSVCKSTSKKIGSCLAPESIELPDLLDKHNEKLPELRSEFRVMILAALEDNKKIKLHASEQANRLHKKDFVYLMLEPGSTKASIDEGLKNWKLVS